MQADVVVFERRVGAPRLAALWLLLLTIPTSYWVVARWGAELEVSLAPMGEAFGQLTTVGPVVALVLGSTAAFLVALVSTTRRFGRCVAGPDWLVFERALLPTWVGRSVALRSEVRDRVLRAGVIHVSLDDAPTPFVVPASTQAELEAALLELGRRLDIDPVSAGRRFGRREAWQQLALTLFGICCAGATALVLHQRLGEGWTWPAFIGLVVLALPLGLCVSAALTPGGRRVYVGRHGLAMGEELFTWDELTFVGLGEGYLACAAGRRTCLAFVGADEAKVRDAIAARLAAADRPVEELVAPLPASEAGWRRRARWLLQVAPSAFVPVGVLVAACVMPNYELFSRSDDEGRTLCVIHAHDGDRPAVIALVASGCGPIALRTAEWWPQTLSMRGASTTIDLPPGATFVHISREGVVSSSPAWAPTVAYQELRPRPGSWGGPLSNAPLSIPEQLEELAEGVDDGTVRAVLLTR